MWEWTEYKKENKKQTDITLHTALQSWDLRRTKTKAQMYFAVNH